MKNRIIIFSIILFICRIIVLFFGREASYENWYLSQQSLHSENQRIVLFCFLIAFAIWSGRRWGQLRLSQVMSSLCFSWLYLVVIFLFSIGALEQSAFWLFTQGHLASSDIFSMIAYRLFYSNSYSLVHFLLYLVFIYGAIRKKTCNIVFVVNLIIGSVIACFYSPSHVLKVLDLNFNTLILLACFISLFLCFRNKFPAGIKAYKVFSYLPVCSFLTVVAMWYGKITWERPIHYSFYIVMIMGLLFCLFASEFKQRKFLKQHLVMWYFTYVVICVSVAGGCQSGVNYLRTLNYSFTLPLYFLELFILTILFAYLYKKVYNLKVRTYLTLVDLLAYVVILINFVDIAVLVNYNSRLSHQMFVMAYDAKLVLLSLDRELLAVIFISIVFIPFLLRYAVKAVNKCGSSKTVNLSGGLICLFILLFGLAISASEGFRFNNLYLGALSNFAYSLVGSPSKSYECLGYSDFKKGMEEFGFSTYESVALKSNLSKGNFARRKLNVLLILMESSYNKYLSIFGYNKETQPYTKRFLDRMELFPNFYSTHPSSFHGEFATITSLQSPVEYVSRTNPRIECETLFSVLKRAGYSTSMFYSSFRSYSNLWDFLNNRGIDEFYDSKNMPIKGDKKINWGVSEEYTVASVKQKLKASSKSSQPFCLMYRPVSPHRPFDGTPERFQFFEKKATDLFSGQRVLPDFLNSLIYMDFLIADILSELERNGQLDSTLVVISNDHGEWVEGKLGHGFDVDPELTNSPLIIMNPLRKGYRVNYSLGSQMDIMPTILDILGIDLPKGKPILGKSLYRYSTVNKRLFFTSGRERGFIDNGAYYRELGGLWKRYSVEFDNTKTHFINDNYSFSQEEMSKCKDLLSRFEKFNESIINNYSLYLNRLKKGSDE